MGREGIYRWLNVIINTELQHFQLDELGGLNPALTTNLLSKVKHGVPSSALQENY